MKFTMFKMLGVLCLLWAAGPAWGGDFGIITDDSGEVKLLSNGKEKTRLSGSSIATGDRLLLGKGASVTVVAYSNCWEYLIKGQGKVEISKDGVKVIEGFKNIKTSIRELPVCIKPGGKDSAAGGLALISRDGTLPPESASVPAAAAAENSGQPGKGAIEPEQRLVAAGVGVESLRKEFEDGKASNSTLITLILHDLEKGDKERAKTYLTELEKKMSPESEILKSLSVRIE